MNKFVLIFINHVSGYLYQVPFLYESKEKFNEDYINGICSDEEIFKLGNVYFGLSSHKLHDILTVDEWYEQYSNK